MTVTIHRGINQIGGCITEIATATTKILIDLGHNLPKGDKPSEDDKANNGAVGELTGGVSAVFYTHYHGDHVDLFKYVPDGVTQYIGETAKKVMLAKYQRLSKAKNISEITPGDYQKLETFRTFKAKDRISVGDIRVSPYFVSHSACDAYMFVVEAEGKRILHTGDFRGHGYLSKGLIPSIEHYVLKDKVDVLITEGTMLSRAEEETLTEKELQKEATRYLKQYKYVFAMCSSTDMERLAAFHRATQESDKRLYADDFQSEILQIFAEAYGDNPFFRFDNRQYYKYGHKRQWDALLRNGFCLLVRGNRFQKSKIEKLLAKLPADQTLLIYSLWDGYLRNGENRMQDYADIWDMFESRARVQLHTSGHATRQTLAEVCNRINPTTAIIPIHRDASTQFADLLITEELKGKIVTSSDTKNDIEIKIK
jgi:ribonuclease J